MSEHAMSGLRDLFLSFQLDSVEEETERLLKEGASAQDFLDICKPCFEEIGKKFEAGEYFLPQLVVAGEMFKKVSAKVEAALSSNAVTEEAGRIVLGTPKGDIHNLGKNIFAIMAKASGFTVYDLGVDVSPETFIEKIEQTGATIIGLSSLLTTTYTAIEKIVSLLEEKGLRNRTHVIIGGGATEKSLIEKLKVDAQTCDAYEGVRLIQNFIEKQNPA